MRLTRADIAALLIALGAAVTGVVVWNHGTVDVGMTLRVLDSSEAAELGYEPALTEPMVVVDDVTPGGNADRNGFWPGARIIALTRTDGVPVALGKPNTGIQNSAWEYSGPYPVELDLTRAGEVRLPIEAIPSELIANIASGDVAPDEHWIYTSASMQRGQLEYELNQSLWLAAGGLLAGILVWRLLVHGLGGPVGRRRAPVAGAAVATPALILPAVAVGTPAGIAGGFLAPAAVALILGVSIARGHPDRAWAQTATAGALVAASLAALLVVRSLTSPALPQDAGMILVVLAAIGLVPALVVGSAPGTTIRQRASLASLGVMPAAALTFLAQDRFEPAIPLILVGLLIGWQLLPIERALAFVGGSVGQVRSRASGIAVPEPAPVQAATRDLIAYLLLGASAFLTLGLPITAEIGGSVFYGAWTVVIGVGLAALVGFAIRRGFLGEAWTDAALPLAAAVGVPVILANVSMGGFNVPWVAIPTVAAAYLVAGVLAERHTDPLWRRRLMLTTTVLVGIIMLLSVPGASMAIPLIGLVALIPGVPVAFADVPGEARAMTARLETMAVSLTPGVAATMLVPSIGILFLAVWLVAVVVWRQYTLNPLLGMAQRTQLQRDLAVAAAETERARLAADLHDDALQQLTMLVRTLDEGGHTAEANEAREVATKLRSVVGDLRLPILDDLGAGAALEWLVERVEPLAGGPVKLERSDETRPPANVELAVFRVAQEALTNAIKHGKPPIAVRYDVRTDGRVTLAIDDAGAGIGEQAAEEAPRQGHFGLANMQQRAEQIGALLDVRRWPAGGTRVALEWRPQGS